MTRFMMYIYSCIQELFFSFKYDDTKCYNFCFNVYTSTVCNLTKLFRLRKLAPVKLPISNICLPGPPIAGQIVSAVKEGCRQAFLKQPCRLMIAMYKCEIQVPNIFRILLCVVVVVGLFLHFWSMRNTTNKRIMNCLTNKTTTLTTVNVIMHLSLMNIHVSVFRQLLKCWDESMEFWQNAKEESYARN